MVSYFWVGAPFKNLFIASIISVVLGYSSLSIMDLSPSMTGAFIYTGACWAPLAIILISVFVNLFTLVRVRLEDHDADSWLMITSFAGSKKIGPISRLLLERSTVRQPGVHFGGVVRNEYSLFACTDGERELLLKSANSSSVVKLAALICKRFSVNCENVNTTPPVRSVFFVAILSLIAYFTVLTFLVRGDSRLIEYVDLNTGLSFLEKKPFFHGILMDDYSLKSGGYNVIVREGEAALGRRVVMGWLSLNYFSESKRLETLRLALGGRRNVHDDHLHDVMQVLAKELVRKVEADFSRRTYWQDVVFSEDGISIAEFGALLIEVNLYLYNQNHITRGKIEL